MTIRNLDEEYRAYQEGRKSVIRELEDGTFFTEPDGIGPEYCASYIHKEDLEGKEKE